MNILLAICGRHDGQLLLAAVIVCAVAASAGVELFARLPSFPVRTRRVWLWLIGLLIGWGIWAMHFVAMLAFEPGVATAFDPTPTAGSLLVAVVSAKRAFTLAADPLRRSAVRGGCVLGAGIALMHYMGMAGFRIGGAALWDTRYVFLSIAIGVAFAAAAVALVKPGASLRRRIASVGLLTAGICGLHLAGMRAVSFLPRADAPVRTGVSTETLGWAIAVLTIVVAATVTAGLAAEARNRQSATRQIRDAVDCVLDAMAIFDNDDRLLVWNCRYEADAGPLVAGMTAEQVFDSFAYRDPSMGVALRNTWRRHRRAAPSWNGASFAHERSDGRWLRIDHRATGDGGLVTVMVDITELKRDAEKLARALDEAQAASRAKVEFLANVSHELRTPMNAVVGALHLLRSEPIPQSAVRLVDEAIARGEMLGALLEDVIDLSWLESGDIELTLQPTDAVALATGVAEMLRPEAARKGLQLVLQPCAGLPWAMADPARLRQSLFNLISNAIKFTERGAVVIRISTRIGPGGVRLRFEVEDTGIGIAREAQEQIFEPFWQVDGSATRRFGGCGLGLAVTRKLVRLMAGEVGLVSRPGAGATFWLEIAAHEPPVETCEALAPPLAGLRILLVEDNQTNRLIASRLVQTLGAIVETAEDGEAGLEQATHSAFDLILMDIQMPGIDGREVTRRLRRSHGPNASTPVIALTANVLAHERRSYFAAGMNGVVAKPLSPSSLLAEIGRLSDAVTSAP